MTSIDSIKRQLYPLTDENTVFRTCDAFGDIVVYDVDKWRILTFGSIFEQSCIERENPSDLVHEYSQAMLLPLLAQRPEHVTILGLGGGGLIQNLAHTLPATQFDIVELRQTVIDVAYSYFYLPRAPRIRVHCDDADSYVSNADIGSTDLILCDLYDANEASATQLDAAFYRRCKLLLRSEGWLALNYHQLPSIEHPTIKSICQFFESVFLCVVSSGNWVVLATNARSARDDSWQHQQQFDGLLRRQLALHSHRLIRIEKAFLPDPA